MDHKTNIDEAQKPIRDDSAGHIGWAMAASILVQNTPRDGDQSDFFQDMLFALRHGGVAGGAAICALHGRTNRPWPKGLGGTRDPKDWYEYLNQNGFLGKGLEPRRDHLKRKTIANATFANQGEPLSKIISPRKGGYIFASTSERSRIRHIQPLDRQPWHTHVSNSVLAAVPTKIIMPMGVRNLFLSNFL